MIPEISDDREHGSGVHHDQQHGHGGTRRVQPHEFFRGNDVRRTGHRQQLARALNQGQNQNLKIIQHVYEFHPPGPGTTLAAGDSVMVS
jgi:hypothetical protein